MWNEKSRVDGNICFDTRIGQLNEKQLIEKYNLNGPRYTSYPTAIELKEQPLNKQSVTTAMAKSDNDELSLYIHIPFCKQLCYYCGCHKYLARNESKAFAYVDSILEELASWQASCNEHYKVSQIHFGGGTPTFVDNSTISKIVGKISADYSVTENAEISIEFDPRTCDAKRLAELIEMGFNRFSFGIQDFNPETQIAINRQQDIKMIEPLVKVLKDKAIPFNFDLIYGLPYQTQSRFNDTVNQVLRLRPNRLSVFNYAHMPHLFAEQRRIDEAALPSATEKLAIQLNTMKQLTDDGYVYLGIDHYALPDDSLAQEQKKQQLHRNFQGYTTKGHCDLLGIGLSSISQIGQLMFQNEKELSGYQHKVSNDGVAITKHLYKSLSDQARWYVIKNLICNFELNITPYETKFGHLFNEEYKNEIAKLQTYQRDGLVKISNESIKITDLGRLFARLICKEFDQYLQDKMISKQFSKAI
ncbi:oxygen-independent coproporphyrinogen III oxidase [Catenovulum sp. SM1970]|uniref:oxygen-independent coproporphyrinogen III oxidase n=1 Tax=Marinifaba aquimaris TaxID=2741323 RepID=UPI0015726E21|nr:oxygen-independent coproporphyrinogen III oxidase [Marinifaba aquimaris]NTS76725.1 oxygen-independent coproporphyrinogen III oxidase [Marinifaba aquimaris]